MYVPIVTTFLLVSFVPAYIYKLFELKCNNNEIYHSSLTEGEGKIKYFLNVIKTKGEEGQQQGNLRDG